MGRAHDPRSAAIGGSCEDRRLAESTGGERHTVTQAGPLGASYRCSGPTCLWRAATEEGPGAMNLIQTIEAEEIAKAARTIPTFRPGDTLRSEEHTSELQSLIRISNAVFCLNKQKTRIIT